MASTPGILKASNTSSRRQKPTRLPYSCQAQFGISGEGEPPAGGVSTVRGMVSFASHSSTLTITHTAMRAPFGSFSGGRAMIGEYSIRSVGNILRLRRTDGDRQRRQPVDLRRNHIARQHRADARRRASIDQIACLKPDLSGQLRDHFRHAPDHLASIATLACDAIDQKGDGAMLEMGGLEALGDRRSEERRVG